jgi:peptidoglycan/xylan/chitin deacetylase (PgdA/CDA1 family)
LRVEVALTFDDAFKSQHYIASLLASQGIKATFFVPAHLEKHPIYNSSLLSLQEVKKISKLGHEIGSHGCSHINLLSSSYDEILREVTESKELLENVIGDKVRGFAYPYGFYNNKVIDLVKQYYDYAVTVHLKRYKSCKKLLYTSPIDERDKYALCRLAPKSLFYALPKLLFNLTIMRTEEIKIILVFHNEKPRLVMSMINFFKNIVNARFCTVRELLGLE